MNTIVNPRVAGDRHQPTGTLTAPSSLSSVALRLHTSTALSHSASRSRLAAKIAAVGAAFTLLGSMLAFASPADAYPVRGHVPLAVILCKFSDSPTPAHDPSYFRDFFINRGTGGMADYYHDVSDGNIDSAGSVVLGWYTESQTTATEQGKSRGDRYNDCLNAAAYKAPPETRVVVVTSPGIDEWGGDGAAFLGEDIDLTGAAHEVGHAMGMVHSFSDDPNFRDVSWAQIGEYDDEWDLMSAANVFTTTTARFGSAPPGLNGFGLERIGWLPKPRIYNFGANGELSTDVLVTSLEQPAGSGYLYVRVPFDPGDLRHYYTVELRTANGWDAGIPNGGGLMLHEVKLNTNDNLYQSYLLRDHTGSRNPVTSLNANGVTISVNWVNLAAHQASVHITGQIATRCLQGYVWREANALDHVCVTPATRSQAAADNAAAASRVNPTGPYGPHTCINGYVWREAFLSDYVCVTPATRSQAAADNAAAASRVNPARLVYG